MDSLQHWGIKGMHWGERRYQNKDGSLTDAGKKRYAADVASNKKNKKDKRLSEEALNDASRWVREDRTRAKNVAESGKRLVEDLKMINRQGIARATSKKPKIDLSNMSDQEMRSKINRALLERQYSDMFNTQNVSKGRQHVNRILEIGGNILTVTGSALGVALAIKQLRSD